MCNIPGQAHTVDSHFYSFCQLFPFHASHRQCYKNKTRRLIKKENTPRTNNKEMILFYIELKSPLY